MPPAAASAPPDIATGESAAAAATPPPVAAAPESPSTVPIIDLAPLLAPTPDPATVAATQAAVAAALTATGCVVVRDPRVDEADNARFLDLLQAYFAQSADAKAADVRPELHYQVGATPELVEEPACLRSPGAKAAADALPPAARPTWPAGADPKWRFFWRVGPRPSDTEFPELNAAPVVPAAFADTWADVLDAWGAKMVAALDTVAAAASAGLGLAPDTLPGLMADGPHLLAPTGSDLIAHATPGTVLAGYHADLNLLTVHGRARFPGLRVWTRGGATVDVVVPPGCLLLQAGKQLEYVTGGAVAAGWHEVVVTPAAAAAAAAAVAAPDAKPGAGWRVSSTVFGHVASDAVLQPLGRFQGVEGAAERYPPIKAGAFVSRELEAIRLKK